jgi:hypothetical protein
MLRAMVLAISLVAGGCAETSGTSGGSQTAPRTGRYGWGALLGADIPADGYIHEQYRSTEESGSRPH